MLKAKVYVAEDLFKRQHVQRLAALLFLDFFIGNDPLDLVWADTWVCLGRATDLYTDREYPGCRQLGERMYSPVTIPSKKSSQGVTFPHQLQITSPPFLSNNRVGTVAVFRRVSVVATLERWPR